MDGAMLWVNFGIFAATAGAAAVAWWQAIEAKQSKQATEALHRAVAEALARTANSSERSVARAAELHDVTWDAYVFDDVPRLILTNRGGDTAHDVHYRVNYRDGVVTTGDVEGATHPLNDILVPIGALPDWRQGWVVSLQWKTEAGAIRTATILSRDGGRRGSTVEVLGE